MSAAQSTRPVVDREALAEALMTGDMREHGWGHERDVALGWADAILASGIVQDAADVRRAVAEEIATAIEARAAGKSQLVQATYERDARIARMVAAHPRSP